jgi:hypothetical protein
MVSFCANAVMLIMNVKANQQTITFFIESLLGCFWNPGQISVSLLSLRTWTPKRIVFSFRVRYSMFVAGKC